MTSGRSKAGSTGRPFNFDLPAEVLAHYQELPSSRVTALLLACGADPQLKNEQGKTPLDWAVQFNYCPTVNLLKKHLRLNQAESV